MQTDPAATTVYYLFVCLPVQITVHKAWVIIREKSASFDSQFEQQYLVKCEQEYLV